MEKEIKARRKEAQWSQKKLSEESDVPKDIIEQIESGRREEEHKYHHLKKIDRALERARSEEAGKE